MVDFNVEDTKKYLIQYSKFEIENPSIQDWKREREVKNKFFQENFSKDSIDKIDEVVINDLISILWSYAGWTNKEYIAKLVLESGINMIQSSFRDLLYSDKSLSQRFDGMKKIKMMGAASISEILAHNNPEIYPIYNRRSKSALLKLGLKWELIPKSSQITGKQYENFQRTVYQVFEVINKIEPSISDLLDLDLFLYFVDMQGQFKTPIEDIEEVDHQTIIEDLLKLGMSLGFEVSGEEKIAKGAVVDAIWRARIANLGIVSYAFEAHVKGSRDSAIINLQRALADPSVQKGIIVSIEKELQNFREEIASLPENLRDAVCYFDVKDLKQAVSYQDGLWEILDRVGLQKRVTPIV